MIAHPTADGEKRKILVVEDSRVDALQARLLLEKQGYHVSIAMDARAAMEHLNHHIPDLVLLDIMLPDKNGWEVCKDIKQFTSAQGHFVPVVLLTSLGDVDDKVIGFESGADDYLVKPPAKKELLARIRSLLRIRDLQENLRRAHKKLSRAHGVIKRDIKIVAEIQRSFLRDTFPDHPDLDLAAQYQPSYHAGGDYYDLVEVDEDHLGFMVADIAGHGVSAAVVMAITQMTVKEFAVGITSPGAALKRINEKLNRHLSSDHFITVFYAILNQKTMGLVYTSAGHNPMMYYSSGSDVVLPLRTGPDFPLRTFETKQYEEKSLPLQRGDKILLFTDGVLDVQNPQMDFYGEERLEEVLRKNHHLSSHELIQRIMEDTEAFRKGRKRLDDFTLFVIGRR
ncbi:MAG: SpoIIE family protein phosphatase [bacterium]|jgi:serine phosphatase RsbU (regulator of sigma subunit)|nr:SpoIIE family protein phosphatase [bacterium]